MDLRGAGGPLPASPSLCPHSLRLQPLVLGTRGGPRTCGSERCRLSPPGSLFLTDLSESPSTLLSPSLLFPQLPCSHRELGQSSFLVQPEKVIIYFILFILFILSFLPFLGLLPQHMEVPRPEDELELQLPAYPTATAMPDPSRVCDLHHSSWQHQILNPQSKARDPTRILIHTSWVRFHCATIGTHTLFFYFFGRGVQWLDVGSQYPDQGWSHSHESTKS